MVSRVLSFFGSLFGGDTLQSPGDEATGGAIWTFCRGWTCG
jgi:hypothetical protein